MKKRILVWVLLVGSLFSFVSCGKTREDILGNGADPEELTGVEEESMAQKSEQKYVAGEVLVKFKPELNLNSEEIIRILKEEYECEILDIIKGIEVYRIRIPKGKTVPEMVEVLSGDERVKYAEPNYIYRLQL